MNKPAYLLIVASLCGCGSKAPQNAPATAQTVATVGGQPITRQQFYEYLLRKPSVVVLDSGQRPVDAKVVGSLGEQALRDIVNRQVMADLAKQQGIYPTDAEIDQEIDFRKKGSPTFIENLTAQGLTVRQIRDDITIDLIQERLWTKGVSVTDAEVNDFIKRNPDQFMVPATVSLLYLVVSNEAQKKLVDKALELGQSFRQVAQRYSVVPGPEETKVVFPERQLSRLPPAVRKLVASTAEKKTTPWIKEGTQLVRVHVEKKIPTKRLPIDDAIREKVKRVLALQKGRRQNNLAQTFQDAVRKADVKVQDETLKTMWREDTQAAGR